MLIPQTMSNVSYALRAKIKNHVGVKKVLGKFLLFNKHVIADHDVYLCRFIYEIFGLPTSQVAGKPASYIVIFSNHVNVTSVTIKITL